MDTVFLSVVIPSFDEMANLQKGVLDKVSHFLEKKKFSHEVIIIDDGSKDGSIEFVEKFVKQNQSFSFIKNGHLGKSGAVTTGMLQAKGKYVLFCDMDQATPIEEIDNLLPYFKEGYDIVIGSRSTRRKGSPWTRAFMSRIWMILRDLSIGLNGIQDTQCGFKMFTRESAEKIFKKIQTIHHGFHQVHGSSVSAGFDVEVLFLATKLRYKIKEIPVKWLYVETRRVNPLKDSIEGLQALFAIKRNDIQGVYH